MLKKLNDTEIKTFVYMCVCNAHMNTCTKSIYAVKIGLVLLTS